MNEENEGRKSSRRILSIPLVAATLGIGIALVCLSALLLNLFVTGSELNGVIPYNIRVDGTHLMADILYLDSAYVIYDIDYAESDGIVTLHAKGLPPNFHHRENDRIVSVEYEATEPIRQVRTTERVFWADGEEITALASDIYATRHDYIGDMPADNRTANALNISRRLGGYGNEFFTSQRPYVWKLALREDVAAERRASLESDMESFGYILLAVVGNLDEVRYEYTANGATTEKAVTVKNATDFFGQNIKDCGGNIRLLNKLIRRLELSGD